MSPSTEIEHKEKFERVFRLYYNNVVCYAFHYLNDYELAKEVAQDVFMAIWQNIGHLEEGSLTAYIITIARNKCLNVIKHSKYRFEFENKMKEKTNRGLINIYTLEHTQIDDIIASDIKKRMLQTLDQLPPKTKEAFMLSRFENKTYSEIAQIQNVSRKNIEYRIMCALKHIRHSLADVFSLALGYLASLWYF